MGLRKRGQLAPGYYADLLVLDPRTISTNADFQHPDRFPRGISHVLINGRAVLADGVYDERALAGQVLRRV